MIRLPDIVRYNYPPAEITIKKTPRVIEWYAVFQYKLWLVYYLELRRAKRLYGEVKSQTTYNLSNPNLVCVKIRSIDRNVMLHPNRIIRLFCFVAGSQERQHRTRWFEFFG